MNPRSPRSSRLPVLACLTLLAACGGGGGSGVTPPRGDTLGGQITIPSLAAGGVEYLEHRWNDEAFHAEDAGALALGDVRRLRGQVTPSVDPQDVLRVRVTGKLHVSIALDAGERASCRVFEIESGRELLCLAPGESSSFDVAVAAFDVVVAAGQRATRYTVHLTAEAPAIGAPRALPIAGLVSTPNSAPQARYLGAHHEMRPGEVVVLRAAAVAPVALDVPGAVEVRPGGGPIAVYRLVPTAPLATRAQGAELEQSLELQTALLARRIAAMPGVRAASPNYVYHAFAEPNDTHYKHQWHYRQIKLPQAWDITTGSPDVIVGVLDTGVVLGHPDLAGRLIDGYDLISDPDIALDGDGRDPNPDDPGSGGGVQPSSFHGTHVAGTIGAKSDNGDGVAGIDWNCKLMPLRALGKGGRGTLDDIANGILFAAGLQNSSGTVPAKRCDVLNMSLGGPGASQVMESACADANAAGVLLIAAAGNDNTSTVNYPAGYSSVLSVGSTDAVRARAPYSNFASNIDIWAPGGDSTQDRDADGYGDGVLSTVATGFGSQRQAGYGFLQGTSMACPHVAGVTALILSVRPGIPLSVLKGILTTSSQAGQNLPNGGVLMDAHKALLDAKGTPPSMATLVATPSSLNLGPNDTAGSLALENRGTGNLTYVAGKSGISYAQSGVQWLKNPVLSAPVANLEYSKLAFDIDRTGLGDGDYQAKVLLTFTDGKDEVQTEVPVNLRVGAKQAGNETVYVLLVDADTLETLYQVETTGLQNYKFVFTGIKQGSFLLAAGTDRDGDDILGDDGELFGLWPAEDSPVVLFADGNGATATSLDFTLTDVVTLSTGRRRPTFKLLR
ncbi:MAG: S8 family peptidase [Planctomycetes bacterium]|nr:S8 family peptidase [Planctomycetota bacterium]